MPMCCSELPSVDAGERSVRGVSKRLRLSASPASSPLDSWWAARSRSVWGRAFISMCHNPLGRAPIRRNASNIFETPDVAD